MIHFLTFGALLCANPNQNYPLSPPKINTPSCSQENPPSTSNATYPSHSLILTLESAISQALNSNRQFLETVQNLTQAQYGIDLANSEFQISFTPKSQAGFAAGDREKPRLTFGGGMDVSKKFPYGTLISVAPSIVKFGEKTHTEIQTTLTQPLLRGLGREFQLANLHSAKFSLRTAYRSLNLAQVQLILRTIQTLYDIVKLERSLILNQESLKRIDQFYRAAKLKEKIGLADSLDIYRAEIELRSAEDALKNTRERWEEAKDILRDLLALPLDAEIQIDVPTRFTPHPVDVDQAIDMALNHRIEIEQSHDEWSENKRLSHLAKKNLSPELNLVVNYSNLGRARHFGDSFSKNRENIWGIGLTTSTDINSLSNQIAYEQSLLANASAVRGIDQTKATLVIEVKKAARQLDRAYERILLQEEQIKTANGELHLAKIKFDRGMADNFNVIQAEKTLRSAQQNYWTAVIDHIVGEFQLLAAVGLLIDKPSLSKL